MSDSEGKGAGIIKKVLLVLVAIVLGFIALRLTFWLLKTLVVVAILGTLGYLGYTFISGHLGSKDDETDESESETRRAKSRSSIVREEDPLDDLNEALRELEELQRKRDGR